MLKRFLLLVALLIVVYLLVRTYQVFDYSALAPEKRQQMESVIINSDNPEQLRKLASQNLNDLLVLQAAQSEGALRQMFLLFALFICLISFIFLPEVPPQPISFKKPDLKWKRNKQ